MPVPFLFEEKTYDGPLRNAARIDMMKTKAEAVFPLLEQGGAA